MIGLCKKPPKPTINEDDVWGDDKLNRKDVADKFTNLLDSVEQSFVISINAPYGNGKSFFLERWSQTLDSNNYVALSYNAWGTDFQEHALIPFLYSMFEQIKNKKFIDENTTLFKNFKLALLNLVTVVASNSLTFVTKGLIRGEDVKKVEDAEFFQEYKARNAHLKNFKDTLREIVHQLKITNQKLVIFIDELERCRPTYAVQLLECIKHLFDVDGIIFVLAMDRSQLQHTISNLYGIKMDADGYLRRFVDLELNLPKPSHSEYIKFLYDHHKLEEILEYTEAFSRGGQTLVDSMAFCANAFELTLRQIEQCFTELNVAIRTMSKNKTFFPILLTLLVCLKVKNPLLYKRLDYVDIENAMAKLERMLDNSTLNPHQAMLVKVFFLVGLDDGQTQFVKKQVQKILEIMNTVQADQNLQESAKEELEILNRAQGIQNQHSLLECSQRFVSHLKQYLAFS